MWRNRIAFRPTMLELLDARTPSASVVFVDAWTSYGGPSSSTRPAAAVTTRTSATSSSRSSTHATDNGESGSREVERRLRRGRDRDASARPLQGFAATPAAALFEVTIRPFFRVAARALRERYEGSVERFFEQLRRTSAARAPRRRPRAPAVGLRRGVLGRRRRYGAAAVRHRDRRGDPGALGALARVGLPTLVPRHADALKDLRAIYIDAGTPRRVVRRPHGGVAPPTPRRPRRQRPPHRAVRRDAPGIEYRYPLGIRYLAERLH